MAGDELLMILICQEMKWDYFTYLSQPSWFITALREKINLDSEHQKKLERKVKK